MGGCRLTIVDDVLNRSFYKLGLIVGRNPGYFIIIPVLLTLLMITGYQRIYYEMDPEYLFSPVSGQGKFERRIVEEHFKVNYSHRFGRVIIVSKDNDTNMLRAEVWKELRQLDDLVQNMTVTLPSGETFSYRDECARCNEAN
ncbi:putative cholesterol transport protein [Operophtera brumata]|uniref:Putative cholesterol transport protein n=1 Tax=Operophtera brumata TaxID=104452 RepID=A0A0L7LDD7_OPEBR|nr:putative cholesterol transport protein [Operophtera brumata]